MRWIKGDMDKRRYGYRGERKIGRSGNREWELEGVRERERGRYMLGGKGKGGGTVRERV